MDENLTTLGNEGAAPAEPEQTPQIPPTPVSEAVEIKKPKPYLLIGVIISVAFLLVVSTGTVLALVAYNKVPVKNAKVKAKITDFVMMLPGTPKTAEYVMAKATEMQVKAAKTAEFDASFSIDSADIARLLGPSGMRQQKLEVAVKGAMDLRNVEEPKIRTSLDITNQLSMDLVVVGNKTYVSAKKLPIVLNALMGSMGMSDKLEDIVLNKWIFIDGSELGTEAGKISDQDTQLTDKDMDILVEVVREEVYTSMSDKLKLETVQLEGRDGKSYKVSINLSGIEFGELMYNTMKALSESGVKAFEIPEGYEERDLEQYRKNMQETNPVRNISLEYYIDKSTFYVHKYVVSAEVEGTSPMGSMNSVLGTFDEMIEEQENEEMPPAGYEGVKRYEPYVMDDTTESNDSLNDVYEPMDPGLMPPTYPITPSPLPPIDITKKDIVKFVGVINISKHGEDVQIEAPQDYVTAEEVMEELFSTFKVGDVEGTLADSRDSKRKMDIDTLSTSITMALSDGEITLTNTFGLCRPACDSQNGTQGVTGTDYDWVKFNVPQGRTGLGLYIPTLPVDPLNEGLYIYSFASDGTGFELNAVLESPNSAELMTTDNGNNPNVYEVGTNLDILQ